MFVYRMRPRRVSSFGYPRTSRSGERFALDSRMAAYRRLEDWSNALISSLVSPLLFQARYAFSSCKRNSKRNIGVDVPCLGSHLLNQRGNMREWVSGVPIRQETCRACSLWNLSFRFSVIPPTGTCQNRDVLVSAGRTM